MYKVAEGIARGAHAGEMRRDDKTPYFQHVKAVADANRGNWDLMTVGILHDTLEDTPVTVADLKAAGIPAHIVTAVLALTKHKFKAPKKPKQKKPRKKWTKTEEAAALQEYLDYIQKNVLPNKLARQVKLADLNHNLSDNTDPWQIKKYEAGRKVIREFKGLGKVKK